jgi:hypothetical protein
MLRGDITLLDGCSRQVPFMEWSTCVVVLPIGAAVPTTLFPMKSPATSDAEKAVLSVGWLSTDTTSISASAATTTTNNTCSLNFGVLDPVDLRAHITVGATIPGEVVSLETTADDQHVIVLYRPTGHSHRVSRISGTAVSSCSHCVAVYGARTLHPIWEQELSGDANSGFIVAALPGPQVPTMPGVPRRSAGELMYSIVRLCPELRKQEGEHSITQEVSITVCALTPATSAEQAQPSTYTSTPLATEIISCPVRTPTPLSAAALAAGELPPPPSSACYIKALNAELLVLCTPNNELHLIGWKFASSNSHNSSGGAKEAKLGVISITELQNKVKFHSSTRTFHFLQLLLHKLQQEGTVVEVTAVAGSHVLVSIALVGVEIYTLVPGSCDGATALPALQVRA